MQSTVNNPSGGIYVEKTLKTLRKELMMIGNS